MELSPPRVFCIGTHHKSGTIWMRQVFRAFAMQLSVPIHGAYGKRAAHHIPEAGRVFLTNWSSKFHSSLLARSDARILHVIRDPRDILLSGARYHCVAPVEGEEFLHHPRVDLNGKTYQEHIQSLDFEDQLLFEMAEKHAITLHQMVEWDYGAKNRIELRYEELMRDTRGTLFARALRNMGFAWREIFRGRRIFLRHSLFGGLSDEESRNSRIKLHVADGSIAQWRRRLPRSVAEIYAENFGEALVALGYEKHPTAWLSQLQTSA